MKYVCRIALMMLMLIACLVNVKAEVIVYPSHEIQNGSITKDGITISGVKYYKNSNYYTEVPEAFGTTNFTISSNVGNIIMIGISYSPYYFYEEEAANNGVGDYDKETNYRQIRSEYLGDLVSSEGTIEDDNNSGGYSIWRGSSNCISFNCNTQLFVASFHIYLEGDELPEKKPFTNSYHYYYYNDNGPDEEFNTLTLCYGFVDFVEDYFSGGTWSTSRINNVFCEGGSMPGPTSSSEDASDFYNEIKFDGSFSEYYPHNISKMFQNVKCVSTVDFSKLNLSEVNNASYMFKNSNVEVKNLHINEGENLSYMFCGYANTSIDISSWNFSSNVVVTGMFSNSSIKYIAVGPSINNARNDIFNGLGTYSNPCYLEIIGDVDLGQTPGTNVFYWKGGYFRLSQKEAYVSVEEKVNIVEPAYQKKYINRAQNNVSYNYTFRYDTRKSTYAKTFSLEETALDGYKKWVSDFNSLYENKYDDYWYYEDENGNYKRIENVVLAFDPSFADYRPTSTSEWFNGCQAEKIEGLQYLNTSEVTDMSFMFCGCHNLSSIDVSHFDTSKVTDMTCMFESCHLQSLDLRNFNTSNVTNMTSMFFSFSSETLDLSSFNTSNVTSMCGMFGDCEFVSLDLSNFDTSKVTNMIGMFQNCYKMQSLNLSSFDTSNVTNMGSMFVECNKFTTLDVSNFNTSKVTDMSGMFDGCSNLVSLDVSNFNTSKVTDMSGMFRYCKKLTSLDVSNFDTSNLVEGQWNGSYEMFSDCSSLKELSVSSTMANIQENACQRVGSKNSPCTIYAPKDFDYGTDTSQPYFIWKNGFFVKGAANNPYTVGDIITYEGLQYQVTKVEDDGNEVTLIKNPDAQGEIDIPSEITNESGTVGFTVTAIEDYAFYNCANITKLSIPASVQSIGKAITSCCTILNEITVAENNPYYDSRDNCNAIINTATGELIAGCNKTTIPEGVTAIGTEAMRGMFDLEGIVLPKTLTRIGNRAFYYCKKLTGHLAIPEGVTEIETYAFYKCTGITAISLPSTITTMGTCAFRECTNVTWVSCYADTPPSIDSRMFGKFAGCTLMVPIGSVDTYKAATNWKKFDPIIRESVVSVEDVAILTGNKGTARISLDNGTNVYTGCQFNITLPEGTDLVKQTHGGYDYTVSSRFSGTPSVQITPQEDGSYMVLIYSMNNTAINGSEGVLISLPVKTNTDLSIGSYPGAITNIAFNNPDNTSAYLHDVTFNITMPSFALGDVNHDRTVNITDVMMTVNHVVGQTPAGFHVEDADVNGDHVINISDIMAIVNLVVNATSANAPAHAREAMTDAISLMPTTQGYAIALQNIELYTALQMDIQLKSDASFNARLADNRSDGHCIICSDLGNGYHRIAIYSLNGHAIKGNDGILLQLETNGKHDAQPEVTNVQLTNRLFESVTLSDISFPTDITNIDEDGVNDSPAYNVQGIRMPKHHHGILIQNGKKQIEKR